MSGSIAALRRKRLPIADFFELLSVLILICTGESEHVDQHKKQEVILLLARIGANEIGVVKYKPSDAVEARVMASARAKSILTAYLREQRIL